MQFSKQILPLDKMGENLSEVEIASLALKNKCIFLFRTNNKLILLSNYGQYTCNKDTIN